jgi:hypothetical protein
MAVVFLASVMLTVQVPNPEQAPVHPWNLLPAAAVAVSVTLASWLNAAEQLAPQLIPEGEETTVPVPVPALPTVKVY